MQSCFLKPAVYGNVGIKVRDCVTKGDRRVMTWVTCDGTSGRGGRPGAEMSGKKHRRKPQAFGEKKMKLGSCVFNNESKRQTLLRNTLNNINYDIKKKKKERKKKDRNQSKQSLRSHQRQISKTQSSGKPVTVDLQ